ncbi:MAG: hypothetical protein ACYCQJ_05175 [Nitrososphaerales archaeon]
MSSTFNDAKYANFDIQSYEAFLQLRRSKITRESYSTGIRMILGETNPNAFAALAKDFPEKAENRIIQWVLEHRDTPGRNGKKPSGATFRAYLSSLKSFLEYYGANRVNWKRIIQVTPMPRKATKKRPYELNEIRRLLAALDFRGKFSVLFYVSTGARLASIDDPRPLTVGDVEILELEIEAKKIRIGHVKIYSDENEEYDTFLTTEALQVMERYLEFRRNFGERIGPTSYLFRAEMDLREAKKDPNKIPSMLRPATHHAIKGAIEKALVSIGLQNREFKMVHGFRSFYKTTLENSGMKSVAVERLLGHMGRLDNSYYKPSIAELAKEFARHQHLLIVDEAESLSVKLNEQEKSYAQAIIELKNSYEARLLKVELALQGHQLDRLQSAGTR